MAIKLTEKVYYRVPLPRPQSPGGITSKEREGALFRGIYKERKFEVSVCPFKGLSEHELEISCLELEGVLLKNDGINHRHPNPHVEYALYQIIEGPFENKSVHENTLLSLDELDQIKSEKCVKIKITPRYSQEQLFKLVETMKTSNALFRLDGNMSFTGEQLLTLWQHFESEGVVGSIDYFEEPLNNYENYLSLPDELPYAHEEFLKNYLETPSKARAVIIKPGQQGISILEKIKQEHSDIRIIISSAFDFDDEIPCLRWLASQYNPQDFHGLRAILKKDSLSITKTIKF